LPAQRVVGYWKPPQAATSAATEIEAAESSHRFEIEIHESLQIMTDTDTHKMKALSESAFKIINLPSSICNQIGLGIFPSDVAWTKPS